MRPILAIAAFLAASGASVHAVEAPASTATADLSKEMVPIPAGCFQMGSEDGDDDERPVHKVCLDAFHMDRYEVTQGEYMATIGENPSGFSACGQSCPVENVSWDEALKYCKLQGKDLPTEAQWEYAARAGTRTKWFWGNDDKAIGQYAWYKGNSGAKTHPVGQKQPNPWGLHDMTGNAWEWVKDRKGKYWGEEETNPTGSNTGAYRALRGGGWNFPANTMRSSYRSSNLPIYRNLGFRCVSP